MASARRHSGRTQTEAIVSSALRWGILATGGIAHSFAADLRVAGLTITAVGSRTPAGAAAFAAEFGIPTAHASYEALVADDAVDVVYIATPHPLHVENALLAIEAGKHVLVEKPFTVTERDARRIAERAAEKGVVVMEAMWTRFLPHMIRVRELVASGAIGEVRTVIADHTQLLPSDPAHRLNDPALGGGALLDLGIYPVSFAVDILGIPAEILARASMTPAGVDRQTAMMFHYDDGRQALLTCALDTAGPNRAAIIGTAGFIEIDRTWYAPTTVRHLDPTGAVIETIDGAVPGRGMQFQALELERRVAGGQPSSLPIAETVAIMGVLDEVRSIIGLRYPGE